MREEIKTPAAEEEVKSAPLKRLPDLKTLREIRGLSIEEIFLMTRVSVTNLEAIENGEFHLLPAPVYTKKFIQAYANAIGIDAGDILAHYQRYVNERQAVPEDVTVVKAQITFDRKPSKRYLWYAVPAVALIVAAGIMYAQHNVTDAKLKEVAPKPAPAVKERPLEAVTQVPQAPPPAVTQAAPPATVVHEETTQTPSNAQLDLLIEATEDTWLKITEDSNPPFQITLKTGATLSRKAREFFIVDVGNAAGVNITFHGKSLGSLGRKGQVVHLRLPQQ